MKEMTRYGLTLALICAIASLSLAVANSLTKPRIISQAKAEEEAALKEVMPEAAKFEPVKSGEETAYYKAYSDDSKLFGFAFKAAGKGYSSIVETLVGMSKEGNINAIKVLSQNETPGLGVRITEPAFTGLFSNKNIAELSDIRVITGATISSRAVINSVKMKAEEVKEMIKNDPSINTQGHAERTEGKSKHEK